MSPAPRLTVASSLVSEENYRRMMQIVYEAVRSGLAPWEPGRIAMYRSDDYLGDPEIAIRIERFPELTFKATFDQWLIDPTSMVTELAEKAFKFYRYREALPVEDHILLGEE